MTAASAPQDVSAGQLIIDSLQHCSPVELAILGDASRHHRDVAASYGRAELAIVWSVLGVAADVILAAHADVLTEIDRAEIDALGDGEPS